MEAHFELKWFTSFCIDILSANDIILSFLGDRFFDGKVPPNYCLSFSEFSIIFISTMISLMVRRACHIFYPLELSNSGFVIKP